MFGVSVCERRGLCDFIVKIVFFLETREMLLVYLCLWISKLNKMNWIYICLFDLVCVIFDFLSLLVWSGKILVMNGTVYLYVWFGYVRNVYWRVLIPYLYIYLVWLYSYSICLVCWVWLLTWLQKMMMGTSTWICITRVSIISLMYKMHSCI